jgi:ferredoxin
MAEGVRKFLESERRRILSSCTSCGKCYEVCPMTRYIEKKGEATATEITSGVLRLLRDGSTDASALGWTAVCIRSGSCVPACPENVNPEMMLRLAKIIAVGGLGGEKAIPLKEDRDYFARVRAFAQLQLSDAEIKAWME